MEIPYSTWNKPIGDTSGDIRRLDSVIRYSSIPVTFSEATSTHMYWVALYSALILKTLNWKRVSMEKVILHAITHDIGECVTGDIVRPMKYASPKMKATVDEAEKILSEKMLPKSILSLMDPPNSKVKAVVKAADFMSLFHFMKREAARHNYEIIPYFRRMEKDLELMADNSAQPLRGLYIAMGHEAADVAESCFGDDYYGRRWYREI